MNRVSNIHDFSKNESDMCETKTVLFSLSKTLSVAANFRIYQVHAEKKTGHHSEIKISRSLQKRVQEVSFERWRMVVSSVQRCFRLYLFIVVLRKTL